MTKTRTHLLAGLAALAVTGSAFVIAPSASAALTAPVWTASSMVRVGPTDAPRSTTSASISAARNEYESFQVVVSGGASGVSNVNIAVSDLTGPGGAVIGRSNVTPYREHYVNVTTSSPRRGGTNEPGPAGLYPDALIPFTNPDTGAALNGTIRAAGVSVAAGKNQPYWFDVHVPSTATAGSYSGSVTVSTDQGSVQVPVALQVWDFTLPQRPALKSSFLDWSQNPAIAKELLKSRLMPAWSGSNLASYDTTYGVNATNMQFFSGADVSTCTMQQPPAQSTLQNTANTLRRQGVDLYNYTADEIDQCPGLTSTVQAWARALHSVGSKQLITMAPQSSLYSDGAGGFGVDQWVVLPWMYDKNPSAVKDALGRGMEVWSYNTLVQDSYSPKWLIDFSPADFRVQPGFINESLSLDGLLYWRVDAKTSDPYNNVETFQGGYPGDGMLVYPGAQVGLPGGAVPSMRLKWLRDGVDDYDYVELAKKAGHGADALTIARSVGQDWHTWSRDGNAIASARQRIAALVAPSSAAPAPGSTSSPAPSPAPSPSGTPTPTPTSPTSSATDTQPPTAPTALKATAVSSSSVSLAWSASADNVGVTKYAVWRGDANRTNWVQAGTVGGTATSFVDTSRNAGTTYTYAVYAYDAAGNRSTAASNQVQATTSTGTDTVPPSAPTTLRLVSRTTSSLSLAWNPATDNVGVAKYYVWRADRYGNGWTLVGVVPGSSSSFTNTGLTSGTGYTYAVYAYDAAGNRSAGASNQLVAATG